MSHSAPPPGDPVPAPAFDPHPPPGSAPALPLHPPSASRVPGDDWPPWTAPAALVSGLVLAAFGSLLVDIPAALLGVNINPPNLPPGLEIADTVVQDIGFVAAAVIFAQMGGRTVRVWQFGLSPTRLWPAVRLVVLLLLSFLVLSVAWGALVDVKPEKILDQLGANRNALLLVLSAALTTVVAPISEELLFRGFIFSALRNLRGPLPAAVLTGVLFGAIHYGSAPALDLIPLAVLGFGLCLLYWRTRSLYPCIAAHCVNNCIAFGALMHWGWQIPVLMLAALGTIALLALVVQAAAAPPAASAVTPDA
ncbi:MAG TPA: CPBP family intramembrane glutamic endopeptidase [Solirubrobacteraceae bacterium]|nr:CPBP family intramembrane glutamic endopeptidase [Solirubrobacteraceae bacterium]